ncbi:MAG: Bug family tripartite tricarboxylate transporter substrate binding protein [Xanthobacteraceae bacterium]
MKLRFACLFAALCVAGAAPVAAQDVAEFYKDKQLRMIIGHQVGADYDIGGRLLAKYLARHIPGRPTVIVQNMPGAGSIIAANFLFNQAPRDGTVFGSFSRNFPSQAMLGLSRIKADPRRFNFIGATAFPSRVCLASGAAKVKTLTDLFKHELIVGGSTGSSLSIMPTVFNHVLGTKFRLIEGYKGVTDTVIAIERGEVEGICASYGQFTNQAQQIKDGKLRILLRAEEVEVPELKHVPSIYTYAKTDEQRYFLRFILSSTEFGRPYVLPPKVPADRVAAIRKAFADAVKDPELVAEAKRMKVDMTYHSPAQLEALVASLYKTPPATVAEVKKLLPNLR